jgi:hypothetical protein
VKFTFDGRTQYAYQKLDWNESATITLTPGSVTTVDDQLL